MQLGLELACIFQQRHKPIVGTDIRKSINCNYYLSISGHIVQNKI